MLFSVSDDSVVLPSEEAIVPSDEAVTGTFSESWTAVVLVCFVLMPVIPLKAEVIEDD